MVTAMPTPMTAIPTTLAPGKRKGRLVGLDRPFSGPLLLSDAGALFCTSREKLADNCRPVLDRTRRTTKNVS